MSKIALEGFGDARLWPITTDDATTFVTGTMVQFVGARNLTKDDTEREYAIPGDNVIYATGTDFAYQDMELEINELDLQTLSQLRGGTYTEATKLYQRKKGDKAIPFAFGYSAPLVDGGFRMWKHMNCILMSVKADLKTKDPNTGKEINTYKVKIRNTYRTADEMIEQIEDGEDNTWLNTVDQLPVGG